MTQRLPGLTWLDSHNPKQLKWAHKYLQRKGEIDPQHHSSTSDELLQKGERLERSRKGILILGQMRGAWRQAKCNASDKDKDRKTYAFKLKIDVKKELALLAKKNKITAADMLSRLISAEQDAHASVEEKLNEAKKTHKELLSNCRNQTNHYRQANSTLRELLEVSVARLCRSVALLEDASISTDSLTEEQQRRIEQLRKQTMAEVDADIKGEIELLRSGLLDRPIKRSNATHHAPKETEANTTDSTPKQQTGLIDQKLAPRQQTPEAKPKPNSVLVSNSVSPIIKHPASGNLEAQPNKNAPHRIKIDKPAQNPQTATQGQHDRYRIYASIGKDGVASAFIKQRLAKTDSTNPLINHLASETAGAAPGERDTDIPRPGTQAVTQSPPSGDESPTTLGDLLCKQGKLSDQS